jgi:2-polyprenyl-3-methyl-5-hydroxy-6-metoxy-1,4-benzoquinol methylase
VGANRTHNPPHASRFFGQLLHKPQDFRYTHFLNPQSTLKILPAETIIKTLKMSKLPLLTPFLQRQRYKMVLPFLKGAVLDLGCGLATVSDFLEPDQRYVGVEVSSPWMDYLRAHRPQHTFYQRDFDVEPLNLDLKFDTILLVAVIEHLEQPGFLLKQLPALLKPKGKVVITTPSPLGDRVHQVGAKIGLFSKEAMHEHETIFTPATLQTIVEANGLELVHARNFLFGGNQLFICQARV